MATILESLQSINAYPIPSPTFARVATARGLELNATITSEVIQSDAYRLAVADLMLWLADAPNVAQGGQNYSFSEDQRSRFQNEAEIVFNELEPSTKRTKYGYKGSRL